MFANCHNQRLRHYPTISIKFDFNAYPLIMLLLPFFLLRSCFSSFCGPQQGIYKINVPQFRRFLIGLMKKLNASLLQEINSIYKQLPPNIYFFDIYLLKYFHKLKMDIHLWRIRIGMFNGTSRSCSSPCKIKNYVITSLPPLLDVFQCIISFFDMLSGPFIHGLLLTLIILDIYCTASLRCFNVARASASANHPDCVKI